MKDITVHELIKEKEGLEIEIQQELTSLIDNFKDQTGCSPRSISISMVETTNFENLVREYKIVNAVVELTLERI